MPMPKKKVQPHSVEQRLRDLERRVAELERIEILGRGRDAKWSRVEGKNEDQH